MTDVSYRQIGRRIAALRKERGWSQSYLASLLGMDQSAFSRIESGKRRTSAAALDLIAKALNVEPGTLLEEADVGLSAYGFSRPYGFLESPLASSPGAAPSDRWLSPAGLAGRDDQVVHAMLRSHDVPAHGDIAASDLGDASFPAEDHEECVSHALREADADWVARGVRPFTAGTAPDARQVASFSQAYESRVRPLPATPDVRGPSLPSLPPSVAAVVADYLRLRATADEAPPWTASWASVDSHGRRRTAGKPTGRTAGRPAAAVSWHEPRDRYARLWRHELGMGVDGPVLDLVALFEDAGVAEVIVARLETGEPVCANVTMPGALGSSPDEVSFLFVNANRPVTLQRHALAHAFGHLALGHGDVVDQRIEWSRATPLEMEANDFAEEFLAPADAVARWYERHGAPRPSVDVLLELAAAFGITFWAAYYRSRAAGRLGEKPQARLMHELRARQWELLPEQSFRGGLRDTLSTLSEESPLPAPGAVGVGGVRPRLTRDPAPATGDAPSDPTTPSGVTATVEAATPAVLRVPSRLRLWTLQALRDGRLSLEQAAAVLRRPPADLAAELERLGLE